jgi:hypothetical protein
MVTELLDGETLRAKLGDPANDQGLADRTEVTFVASGAPHEGEEDVACAALPPNIELGIPTFRRKTSTVPSPSMHSISR